MGLIQQLADEAEAKRKDGTLAADLAALEAELVEPEIDKSDWKGGSGWELYIGHVHLFIIGPGQGQMWIVSDSYYQGQIGTDSERKAARSAVAELNRSHSQDGQLTKAAAMAILAKFQ